MSKVEQSQAKSSKAEQTRAKSSKAEQSQAKNSLAQSALLCLRSVNFRRKDHHYLSFYVRYPYKPGFHHHFMMGQHCSTVDLNLKKKINFKKPQIY